MRDFKIKISNGDWWVIATEFEGLTCYSRAMTIPPKNIKSKNYLNTSVHEILHASKDDLTEAECIRISQDVTDLLWKLGYRLR